MVDDIIKSPRIFVGVLIAAGIFDQFLSNKKKRTDRVTVCQRGKEKKEKVWKFSFKSYPAAFWAVFCFVVSMF